MSVDSLIVFPGEDFFLERDLGQQTIKASKFSCLITELNQSFFNCFIVKTSTTNHEKIILNLFEVSS